MGHGDEAAQGNLSSGTGDQREHELPDDDDDDQEQAGSAEGPPDREAMKGEDGETERPDQSQLQEGAADELEVVRIVMGPARALPIVQVRAQAAQPNRAQRMDEMPGGVKDEKEDTAQGGGHHPVQLRVGARTSHLVVGGFYRRIPVLRRPICTSLRC